MEIKINMKSLKLLIRNMQIKTTLRYNFHLTDGQKSRNSIAYSNDKPVGKQYSHSSLVGAYIGTNLMYGNVTIFLKITNTL